MPSREDEYWAGKKEPKGRGLCPFCGSSNVYYNRRFKSWRCGKCEKSFPSPSYGLGEDFGREARWFGKTTEEMRRKEFAEVVRKGRTKKRRKSRGGSNMLRLPVKIILICASIVAIVLGSHGLYVYFSRLELLFGGGADKLFLAFEVPIRLVPVVEWMSYKGLQSWFIPAVFVFIGLIVGSWGWSIRGGSNILRKLHLW